MKFTLSWLKDHLETSASVEELADKLSSIGLEVEGVDDPAKKLGPFTIARVLEAKQHPNADRLRVCQVDTGSGVVEVVCGAPNAKTGMIGVFAPMGSYIPGTGITLEKKPVRGVVSNGMLVSERELELSDDHEGIIELPAKYGEQLGKRYAEVMGLADPVIEVKLTPNRPDCTGVRGIARDLAAAGLGKLKPEKKITGVEGDFDCPVDIKLDLPKEARDACPCFAGRYLRGVKNGPAPAWMQQRLKAVGLRPINALVDVTNYISMDRGRPLHVYDADKLKGAIRARLGKTGETFAGLDGKTHAVDETMCVIADDRAVLGFGGILGGEETGCTEETTNVLIECAYFDPVAHGRHRPQGRRAERCALPLRARRRPGLHPAGHRSRHRHDAGGGRRQAVEGQGGRRAARDDQGRRFRSRSRREAGRAGAAREADPRHADGARLRARRQGRDGEGHRAELASRRAWLGRSGRGGRAHRRPRQGAVGGHAAHERCRPSRADAAAEARAPRAPCAGRPRHGGGHHVVVHQGRRGTPLRRRQPRRWSSPIPSRAR